jgi:hypothetical protein
MVAGLKICQNDVVYYVDRFVLVHSGILNSVYGFGTSDELFAIRF